MVTLRRIGIRSAGNLGFWLAVAFGLINFFMFMIFILFFARIPLRELPIDFFMQFGFFIFLGAVNAAFSAGMMAFIYNRISKNFGGLQLEFSMPVATVEEKDKTGDADGETPEII